ENEHEVFGKALMLAIAYSASIGGMATLIGTPPNLVLAGVVKESLGVEITFVQWMLFGLPISIVLLLLCWLYLTKVAFRFRQKTFPGGRAEIRRQLQELGGMTAEERQVLVVFILTALAWVSRSFLLKKFIPAIDDTIIALLSMMVLFVLPGRKQGRALLHWSDAARIPWGILLLFGGGLALADGFTDSGLAAWIGDQMKALSLLPLLFLILIIVASVNFLTEITSNLATTAMLLPILAPMAASIGIHPYYLLVAATVAASCAFMLPVATPPNAIVFGSGYLRIPDMVRVGFWLNVISIVLLTAAVYGLLPRVWGWAF
ncbi:MAG: DASS family sodium-coupled anion symporter, partial [Phaeodactylibacter sp.]|nr:DASS family sodium-coupled anion symporter [Phaeodactylibacter sp.]